MCKCELCGRPTVRKQGKACMSCTNKMRAEAVARKAEESRKCKGLENSHGSQHTQER
jgi:hypothetical protein